MLLTESCKVVPSCNDWFNNYFADSAATVSICGSSCFDVSVLSSYYPLLSVLLILFSFAMFFHVHPFKCYIPDSCGFIVFQMMKSPI